MAARARADDQDKSTDVELYLPAGITPATDTNQFGNLWGRLFNYSVEPPE